MLANTNQNQIKQNQNQQNQNQLIPKALSIPNNVPKR